MKNMHGLALVCLVALAAVAASSSAAVAGGRDYLMGSWWPEFGPQDKTLTSVPFEPGAPAVVLLESREDSWGQRGAVYVHQMDRARRIKILTADGVQRFGTFKKVFPETLRSGFIEARTILPDGKVIDAEIKRTVTDDGWQQFEVAFPSVQVGAILDVHYSMLGHVRGDFALEPFDIDQELPVLESRYILIPPNGMEWIASYRGIESTDPEKVLLSAAAGQKLVGATRPYDSTEVGVDGFVSDLHVSGGSAAYVWRFTNRKGIAREPFGPPQDSASPQVFIIPRHVVNFKASYYIANEWPVWLKAATRGWESWLAREKSSVQQLAREVAGGQATDLAKADAIGAALRSKFQVLVYGPLPGHATPEFALAAGKGLSNEMTALAVVMLRAVGVKATMAVTRRPGEGDLITEFPLPTTYNDSLVRIDTANGPVYWNVRSTAPAGDVPVEFAGAYVIPMDGQATGPVALAATPAKVARGNRVQRSIKGSLDRAGVLEADVQISLSGDTAEAFRSRFVAQPEAGRPEIAKSIFAPRFEGDITAVALENLADPAKDLLVTFHWRAPIGRVEGTRVIVPASLTVAAQASDWPDVVRRTDIFFGSTTDVTDSVQVVLPAGAQKVAGPKAAQYMAAGVGKFDGNCDSWSRKLIARRNFRIESPRLAPTAYAAVRQLFTAAAGFDAETITLEMGPAS